MAVSAASAGLSASPATAQQVASVQDLSKLSIEDLANVQVTSVLKTPEPLNDAAAAIYVISGEDIRRSGATSIPEMLRLAPNLQVAQTSPSSYIITARGFSGNSAAQNFSDKLLVLIDGRSVYNPLFSGMYWNMQDVLPENIERIEVISGPGATLWGANAVNGVINIVTKKSSDTQGGTLELGAGNQHVSASLQYGGKLSNELAYRIYAKTFSDSSFETSSGASTHDGWSKPQGGFRLDWTLPGEQLTLQGDLYNGRVHALGGSDQLISGGNLQANWQHDLGNGSSLQVLAYFDQVQPRPDNGNGGFALNTYNLEVQHNFALGSWNNIIWGAGERISDYRITDQLSTVSSLLFVPARRQLNLTNAFIQDQLTLAENFNLIVGIKLENDPFSGITPMPNVRATWRVSDSTMFWAAASRAIRSPTPFDSDVVEKLGPNVLLTGNPDFLPEKLTAYEIGYRGQWSPHVSASISAFDSEYDDLKSIEFSPLGGFPQFPIHWGNMMAGRVFGIEAWGNYLAADWWRLSTGLNLQSESLLFKPGASGLLGLSQAGDDPHHQASLRSSMELSDRVIFDADVRYVGTLPNPKVPAYVELNARLGWAISDHVELSLSGFNLLHAHHQEFAASPSDEVMRSFFIDTRWKF